MKLPNGFGTVYRLQGNRRRPYVVKKTIQHKQKALGYFETFADAMAYLVEYNRDPALLSPSKTHSRKSMHCGKLSISHGSAVKPHASATESLIGIAPASIK